MNQPAITIIINNKTYNLNVGNSESIRSIPVAERQQLITLLEVLKQQGNVAHSSAHQAAAVTDNSLSASINYSAPRSERLSSGDVDSIMAQLIMEERNKQKAGMTKQGLYKWVVGIAVVIILLLALL